MRQSQLFGKTIRETPKDVGNKSTEYLLRGGFIAESVAGRYYMLPLGMRVQDKIMKIVEQEMDVTGAQKMITPTLHPLELWKETNRTSSAGFELMKVVDRRGGEFAIGGTAEEMFVDLVRKYSLSYRDLPFTLYQFSQKFRDEMRARGGLLRVREFMMKDAYSFHADEQDFRTYYYDVMWKAYERIFERLGLKILVAEADNGYIGGEYCHEFIVESEVGESKILATEDGTYSAHEDVATFYLADVNPDEALLPLEIIEQPEWVQTMEDNEKHYKKDKRFFLKNVVYRTTQGDILIVTIRGDLDVNKTKLETGLKLTGQLEDALPEDLEAIGTKTGFVHAWGHTFIKPRRAKSEDRDCRVIYVADNSLKTVKNFIGGQKEIATDSMNVNYGRDFTHEIEGDFSLAQEGFVTKENKKLIAKKGIEVGNIFQLGNHYSSRMHATFADADGKLIEYYMGCYGIGIGRTLATLVEKYNDEKGIIWPEAVAPYQVHLVSLCRSEEQKVQVENLYKQLLEKNIEVLFDDREGITAGQKFADSDLMGIPTRIVVSPRTLETHSVEVKKRNESEAQVVKMTELTF